MIKVNKDEYNLICDTIWGVRPIDKSWATGTSIYQSAWIALDASGKNPRHIDVEELFNIIKSHNNESS